MKSMNRVQQISRAYDELIQRFVAWASAQDDIRAVVAIGSRARTNHPADEWSDLDLLVVVTDPQRYVADAVWIERAGTPRITFVEPTPDGRSVERRVLYEGGLDVDFALAPAAFFTQMAGQQIPPDLADLVRRGVRVLLDKDGLVAGLLTSAAASSGGEKPPLSRMPDEQEFMQVTSDFWYHTVWVAKHLRRGELWWAKSGCDGYLKGLLLHMMEWHAHATRGLEYDTWLRGRFLEEWADPRAVAALKPAFAHYDTADVWGALGATMELFRWLGHETADRLKLAYPTEADLYATQLVNHLRAL